MQFSIEYNLSLGFLLKTSDPSLRTVISASGISELSKMELSEEGVTVCAGVTVSELETILKEAIIKYTGKTFFTKKIVALSD